MVPIGFRPIMVFEWQIEVTVQMSKLGKFMAFHYVSVVHGDDAKMRFYMGIIW